MSHEVLVVVIPPLRRTPVTHRSFLIACLFLALFVPARISFQIHQPRNREDYYH